MNVVRQSITTKTAKKCIITLKNLLSGVSRGWFPLHKKTEFQYSF